MLTVRPRGTADILPDEVHKWQFLENCARDLAGIYGYREIRTPIFEHTELFYHGVGEATDIVEKEMYTFTDRGQRSLTLRPEGTAPVARALLEGGLYRGARPVKLYYLGPMFRYSRPQAGRLRQFHQFGAEAFGSGDPSLDAEIICFLYRYFIRLGLSSYELRLNSVGCAACREGFKEALLAYARPREEGFCLTCRQRMVRNPLRIFDCKSETCRSLLANAPLITAYLCPDCREHFEAVQNYLRVVGVEYVLDPFLVRGLDYYTRTAFEVVRPEIGAQSSLGGGGRYDHLIESLGGPSIPGVGFGIGLERTLRALEMDGWAIEAGGRPEVFVCMGDADCRREGFRLAEELRQSGLKVAIEHEPRSLKAQMRAADRSGAAYGVIIGAPWLEPGRLIVKTMATGEQEELDRESVLKELKIKLSCLRKGDAGGVSG